VHAGRPREGRGAHPAARTVERVVALHAKGGPGVAIALEVGLVRQTVMRWLQRGRYPERRVVPAHTQLRWPTGQADRQRAHQGLQPLASAGVPACGLPRNTGSPASLMPSSSSAPGKASTTTPGHTAAWSSNRRRIGASAATSSQAGTACETSASP
jgi:hypothetical protein